MGGIGSLTGNRKPLMASPRRAFRGAWAVLAHLWELAPAMGDAIGDEPLPWGESGSSPTPKASNLSSSRPTPTLPGSSSGCSTRSSEVDVSELGSLRLQADELLQETKNKTMH